MQSLNKFIPEIHISADPANIPWKDAVVWITDDGKTRVYEWLTKEHISYASWNMGTLSIIPKESSIVGETLTALLVQGKIVLIGTNIPIGR